MLYWRAGGWYEGKAAVRGKKGSSPGNALAFVEVEAEEKKK